MGLTLMGAEMMKRAVWAAVVMAVGVGPAMPIGIMLGGIGGGGAAPTVTSTPVFSVTQLTSGATNNWGAVAGSTFGTNNNVASSVTTRRVPLPFDGIVVKQGVILGTALLAPLFFVTSNYNGTDGAMTCNVATGQQLGVCSGTDGIIAAGTGFQWHFGVGTGGWQQSGAYSQVSFIYRSVNPGHVALFSSPNSSTTADGPNWFGPFGSSSDTTEANVSGVLCPVSCGGTVNAIYMLPNNVEVAGLFHTVTVVKNGVATGSFCQGDGTAHSSGCCANLAGTGTIKGADGTTANCSTIVPTTFAAGDSISFKVQCSGTGCAAITPGIGVDWAPATQGVVPLFGNNKTQGVGFVGMSDQGILAAQGNFNLITAPMTFSNFQICSLLATTGTQQRIGTFQVGTLNGTPPPLYNFAATAMTATTTSGTGACPGGVSGTFLSGKIDPSNSTSTPVAGNAASTAFTIANAPTNTVVKFSMGVKVQ